MRDRDIDRSRSPRRNFGRDEPEQRSSQVGRHPSYAWTSSNDSPAVLQRHEASATQLRRPRHENERSWPLSGSARVRGSVLTFSTRVMAVPSQKPATLADLLAIEERDRLEIVGGELVEKAMPSWRHSRVEAKYGEILAPFNRKAGGRRGPGGWWI